MTRKSVLLTVTAFAILVVCGVLSAGSPEFKAHATTVAVAILAVISLSGVLLALITPLLPDGVQTYGGPESAPEAREQLTAAHHTGDSQ